MNGRERPRSKVRRIHPLRICGFFFFFADSSHDPGYAKAQYAVGCFTEMGIGCHRDPLEANVWYVRAADQGDERARNRLAVIQAASEGADPTRGGKRRKGKRTTETKGWSSEEFKQGMEG